MWQFKHLLLQNFSSLSIHLGGNLFERLFGARHWREDEKSPFERTRILNPKPASGVLKTLRKNMREKTPALAEVQFAQTWAGMIDATPDVVPVMDNIDRLPGLVVGTGFSGHGFGLGPGAGKVLSDLVLGNQSPYDLDRFRYERFFDGTKLTHGPGL